VRDKPSFDDIEPPVIVTSPIDGLTDEQWAERSRRRAQVVRIVFGSVAGLIVGSIAVLHWGLAHRRFGMAALLVLGGCMVLFASLAAQDRGRHAADYAGWIAFPEWKLFDSLPWWAIALIFSAGLAILAALAAVVLISRFPIFGR
jgi:hypothetical protein